MERAVDVLFVVGVIVNLVKGADLILRPHQQKWLQDKCNSLALYLDYTKPAVGLGPPHTNGAAAGYLPCVTGLAPPPQNFEDWEILMNELKNAG